MFVFGLFVSEREVVVTWCDLKKVIGSSTIQSNNEQLPVIPNKIYSINQNSISEKWVALQAKVNKFKQISSVVCVLLNHVRIVTKEFHYSLLVHKQLKQHKEKEKYKWLQVPILPTKSVYLHSNKIKYKERRNPPDKDIVDL